MELDHLDNLFSFIYFHPLTCFSAMAVYKLSLYYGVSNKCFQ